MSALERLRQVVENHHDYARDWKARTGGRVAGYLCTYVPEEILYAAGMLPVRIIGGREPQDVTEPHMYSMYCPFSRDCLAQGLRGKYDYLDVLLTAHACMHTRQTYDSWRRHVPLQYSYYIFMPHHIQTPRARDLLLAELRDFKASLEGWLGRPIPEDDLNRAIEVYNTNRRLLREVYELRKLDPPPVSGLEAMELVLSSSFMDKAEHNRLLEEALREFRTRKESRTGARLMLIGSENDDREFVKLAESLGAWVVADDHCTGSRYFWNEAPQNGDPLEALAVRYLERPPCPHKDLVERRRLSYLEDLARDYKVQGVLLILQKFCDLHEIDLPVIRSFFQEKGIPGVYLEFDTTVPAGQFRTRIEAFLEAIELGI